MLNYSVFSFVYTLGMPQNQEFERLDKRAENFRNQKEGVCNKNYENTWNFNLFLHV